MKADITVSTIFEGLLVIGCAVYLFYLLGYSRTMIITMVQEEDRERAAINFANALISHERIAYEKDGIIYRGIVDVKKLDSLFYKSTKGFKSEEEFKNILFNPDIKEGKITRKELDLGYSQLIGIVYVIDLEKCDENECVVWAGVILPLPSIDDLISDNPIYKFFKCLYESFDRNWLTPTVGCAGFATAGAGVGFFVGGPIGAAIGAGVGCLAGFLSNLFSVAEISNCIIKSAIDIKDFYVSKTITEKQGLPINIIYEDGRIHIGRIIVGLVEWY